MLTQEQPTSRRPSRRRPPLPLPSVQQVAIAVGLVGATLLVDRALLARPAVPAAPPAVPANMGKLHPIVNASWAAESEDGLAIVTELERQGHRVLLADLAKQGLIHRLEPETQVYWTGSAGYLGARVQVRLKDTKQALWTPQSALR